MLECPAPRQYGTEVAMAVLKPFPGIRPPRELAAQVAAPPYDVVSSEEAREMARDNPYSFLRINKPEINFEPSVDPFDERVYRKGAENFRRFLEEGILRRDPLSCFYVYRQTMGGHVQTGLMATASVEEYEQDLIRKHEYTRPDKEDDRVRHIDRLDAQVGPVFLTYRSESHAAALVDSCARGEPEYDFIASGGVRHQLWVVADEERITALAEAFRAVPCLYVADGHHRSAAAQRVKRLRQAANPAHTGAEPYNFFLAVVFPHDQMQILDYNRVVRDLHGLSDAEFLAALVQSFEVTEFRGNGEARPPGKHSFGMYFRGRWYCLKARPILLERSDPVARLDVSLLQDEVLGPLLGIGDPRTDKRIDFVGGIRGLKELQRRVDSGAFAVAFACHPTSMEELMAVADAGRVMPPKSTWFEPKLKSGLVVHSLDREAIARR